MGAPHSHDELWREREVTSTLDVLGEEVDDEAKARRVLQIYRDALEGLGERRHVSLSIKPSHFGWHVNPGLCEARIRELAELCLQRGIDLTIDMEDVDLTDATLDLYRRLRPALPNLGTVLQTRLHRTHRDLLSLEGLGARVRLCIGIYIVTPEHGLQDKREMKRRLVEWLPDALRVLDKVEIATHDAEVVRRCLDMLRERKVPPSRAEFQMLLGVPRRRLQQEILQQGRPLRLYVPYALRKEDAVAYLRRRLLANPAMMGLVLKNLFRRG